MIGAAATVVAALLGIAFKVWLAKRKTSQQQVANTAHAMLKDAVDRTDPGSVADDLRRGDF